MIGMLGSMGVVSRVRGNSELETPVKYACKANQLIKFPVHEAKVKLKMLKLVSKGGVVFLKLNEDLGNIRWRLIREGDIERGSLNGSEIMKVLPPTGLRLVEGKGFKGVGRYKWNRLTGAFLIV